MTAGWGRAAEGPHLPPHTPYVGKSAHSSVPRGGKHFLVGIYWNKYIISLAY